jgi:hypothetical protein
LPCVYHASRATPLTTFPVPCYKYVLRGRQGPRARFKAGGQKVKIMKNVKTGAKTPISGRFEAISSGFQKQKPPPLECCSLFPARFRLVFPPEGKYAASFAPVGAPSRALSLSRLDEAPCRPFPASRAGRQILSLIPIQAETGNRRTNALSSFLFFISYFLFESGRRGRSSCLVAGTAKRRERRGRDKKGHRLCHLAARWRLVMDERVL